jgi:cupin 2 domain-containing protein
VAVGNVFEGIPGELPEELIETLAESAQVRIERIVSKGHMTPEGEWYDQAEAEFVLLVQGQARLEFEGSRALEMKSGDWVVIPAGERHRVNWTSTEPEAVWVCVFYTAD